MILQPIFAREARHTLADLYGGWLERDEFFDLMDDVVLDENLEGSTPQNPKKHVRTLIINDFENTIDPQIKFRWLESQDPGKIQSRTAWKDRKLTFFFLGEFHLCAPEYWKESVDDIMAQMGDQRNTETSQDIIDSLDEVRSLF